MIYDIKIVAVAGNNPLTSKWDEEQSEVVTVEAESLWAARNRVPVFMKMAVQGQLLRFYYRGKLIQREN